MTCPRIAVFLSVCITIAAMGAMPAQAGNAPSSRTAKTELTAKQQIKQLEKAENKFEGTRRFWHNKRLRWTLYLNQQDKKCWDPKMKLHGPLKLCMQARESVREANQQLQNIRFRLASLDPSRPYKLSPDAAMALGKKMAAAVGWTGYQWDCLKSLWGPLESRWRWWADNPTSDAYGIPQALPGSKMGTGWFHNVIVQIRWGLRYIRTHSEFSSPCSALAYRLANGSY